MKAIVAVPARNEEQLISFCLQSLMQQTCDGRFLAYSEYGIIVLVNNSSDNTCSIAREILADHGNAIIDCCNFPPEQLSAGSARRLVMDKAHMWAHRERANDAIILTTDADSVVPSDWIERHLAAYDGTVAAAAGNIRIQHQDWSSLPPQLRQRIRDERRFMDLSAELRQRRGEFDENEWPVNMPASGANLSICNRAYHMIGGLPECSVGEDRALVNSVRQHGLRVARVAGPPVLTSGRLVGRARAGFAETLAAQAADITIPCDEMLESTIAGSGKSGPILPNHLPGEIALMEKMLFD